MQKNGFKNTVKTVKKVKFGVEIGIVYNVDGSGVENSVKTVKK